MQPCGQRPLQLSTGLLATSWAELLQPFMGLLATLGEFFATSDGAPCNPGLLIATSWAELLATIYGAPRNPGGIPCNLRRCSLQPWGSPCDLVGKAPWSMGLLATLRGSLATSDNAPCNPWGLLATLWPGLLATVYEAPCNPGGLLATSEGAPFLDGTGSVQTLADKISLTCTYIFLYFLSLPPCHT